MWLWWAVDLLASEYGWTKDYILDCVYLDDLQHLSKAMDKRKLSEYKMQLAITQNPHTKDPKKLWDVIKSKEEPEPRSEQFDAAGFERLKLAMQTAGGSKILVK